MTYDWTSYNGSGGQVSPGQQYNSISGLWEGLTAGKGKGGQRHSASARAAVARGGKETCTPVFSGSFCTRPSTLSCKERSALWAAGVTREGSVLGSPGQSVL